MFKPGYARGDKWLPNIKGLLSRVGCNDVYLNRGCSDVNVVLYFIHCDQTIRFFFEHAILSPLFISVGWKPQPGQLAVVHVIVAVVVDWQCCFVTTFVVVVAAAATVIVVGSSFVPPPTLLSLSV